MFSLPKILAFLAIAAAVWYGFRLVDRFDKARKRKVAEAEGQPREPRRKREDGVVDLVERDDGSYAVKDEDRRV